MFTRFVFMLFFPLALTLISRPPNAEYQTIQLSPANIPSNTLTTKVNASNELQIECDGEKYGFNPNVADCQNAKSYYKHSTVLFEFGERHSGHSIDVFPLPFRLMGDQALCYFEPVLNDPSLGLGTASLNMFRDAAYALILQCAVRRSMGGIATGIGGENMGLVLGAYRPDVQCRGALAPWASCRMIIGDMPVLETEEVFGPEGNPSVQVTLPRYLESGDGKCVVRMFARGAADISSWFKVWEAATAVYAVCGRHKKVGTFRGLGQLGNIFFTMSEKTSQSGNITTLADVPDDGLLED